MLLVSDWDDAEDGTILDDCHVTSPSSLIGRPDFAQSERKDGEAKRPEVAAGSTYGSEEGGGEDEDVLLVGDYEPEAEEEAYLLGISSTTPDSTGAYRAPTESQEVNLWLDFQ